MIIVDSHTHIQNINESFAPLYTLAEFLHYGQLTIQSLQCTGDLLQNTACALCKSMHAETTYAFGGLDYLTGRDYLTQVKNLREMGFDGMKMLEGKPTTRAMLGKALDDPSYDAYYDYLEATAFPVLFHVADPPEFWDREKIPHWAVEHGWFYDETHVPYVQYYEEVERVLNKHPQLRAIFAHFYFLSDAPACAQKFLDDHPLVSIDVTAGIEMYENFSRDSAFWREFFVKNNRRIIFGTDSSDTIDLSDDTASNGRVNISGYAAMEIEFLRFDKDIEIFGKKLHGLGLPPNALERIFAKNYHKYVGEKPRLMDIDAVKTEASFIRGFLKKGEDVQMLDHLISQL